MAKKKAKILFIGPLPPPVDGQSKATSMALQALQVDCTEVAVVDTNRRSLGRSFLSQVKRLAFDVVPLFLRVLKGRKDADSVYISLSESILGNLKDIAVLFLLLGKLDRTTVHMLGGSGMDVILNHRPLLSFINGIFMRRLRGVIVEGERGHGVFAKHFSLNRIHVVPQLC